ncbi:MFS transporter [Nocardioides sp. zg-1228]|uniref:MFS transporter n=1 Tax=Nocardioides sp. zg-1228 TaxID=2763008 RepID=UPI0016431E5D|nr:MFS transporter [Nocardioides sp. zg-1228]MBC2934089.1 MFS transporter [Nocardioides sp. zg-1228]QSF58840.1 MFS transporter [Nocardioides sp. zg-1228]
MPALRVARNAVGLTFFLNGLVFASWVSRIPEVRSGFDLTNGQLGLVLLAIALGSVLALPTTGAAINALGTVRVVRLGATAAALGMAAAALGLGHLLAVTVAGLFVYGLGIGVWDVAMNVEGAEVERGLRRTIMPRFHAGFSAGTVVGALAGALLIELGVPAAVHLVAVVAVSVVLVWRSSPSFLPVADRHQESAASAARAWLEPRTLLIGVMVLALAMTEGTANDWLAVALVDGHDVSHAVGVAGFAVFVLAMTAGRFAGTGLIDRFGRVAVLWATMVVAAVGVLLMVLADHPALVVTGIVLWGIGASLGFPVGMSAAADDPARAAARVSVVSTIGYAAFLAGPPLLGFVGDRVGTLDALLVVALLLVPAALVVPAAREQRTGERPAAGEGP